MCGIAGIHDRGGAIEPALVDGMLDAIRHRGPDDGDWFGENGIAIGNRRLSIIDVAGGHQPMTNEDGNVVVVFNGEIYNYRELATSLRASGHQLRTDCDTEVIAHLYEERGDDLVHELRGMFTFALWDRRRRRLLIARDRLGIKPLYYAEDGERLLFGSEIKSILRDGRIRPELDTESLVAYLSLKYAPAPRTMFRGIRALPPGHRIVADASGTRVEQWWTLSFADRSPFAGDERAAAAQLRHLLEDAVRSHLVSDVPYGAFLSGGIDSSTIVALMSGMLDHPVRTFAVGYDGDAASISELPYARMVAERYATEHHEVIMGPNDLIERLPAVIWHLDQPIADEAVLPNYLVSELAAQHVKMVLTGEGGDELFAGYARHSFERLSTVARRVPPAAWRVLLAGADRVPGLRRPKLALNALSIRDEAERYVNWFALFNDRRLDALMSSELKATSPLGVSARVFEEHLRASDATDPLSRMLHLDSTLWLPDDLLARGDKTSMASSLEARVPLLDHPLVEFAASLPPNMKVKGRTRKYLLRKVAADLLPEPILTRKKQGFPTPISMWLRGPAHEFARDHLAAERISQRGLFEPAAVAQLLDEHRAGRADHGPLLFGLLSLELWQQAFLDARAVTR